LTLFIFIYKYDYFVVNINIVINIAEVKMSRYLITMVIVGTIIGGGDHMTLGASHMILGASPD
jgi:hypothetical protein